MINNEPLGVIFFLIMVLIGIAFVSVYYRKRYEEMRKFVKKMNCFLIEGEIKQKNKY